MILNEIQLRGTLDFPMELYHVDNKHPRYEMIFHWHKELELMRILEGKLQVSIGEREYEARKGDVLFVNRETVHGALPENCVYECIVYHPEITSGLTSKGPSFADMIAEGSVQVKEYFPACDDEFHRCVNQLFDMAGKKESGYQYSVIGMFCHMYGLMMKNGYYEKMDVSDRNDSVSIIKLKKVLDFIRCSYDRKITLDDMAEVAEISPKYLCTFFKNHTHKSPVEFLISYRIERAVHFLLTTDKPVTEIALHCGFDDLSYFIKTFKRIKGVPPGAFRKK